MKNSINNKTNRHISFNDKSNENEDEQRNTLTHIDFIHATNNEILNRYLLYFEKFLPLFINNNIEKFQLNNLYNQCIKLCTSNKINAKNVWNLQLIDYMDSVAIICHRITIAIVVKSLNWS